MKCNFVFNYIKCFLIIFEIDIFICSYVIYSIRVFKKDIKEIVCMIWYKFYNYNVLFIDEKLFSFIGICRWNIYMYMLF